MNDQKGRFLAKGMLAGSALSSQDSTEKKLLLFVIIAILGSQENAKGGKELNGENRVLSFGSLCEKKI